MTTRRFRPCDCHASQYARQLANGIGFPSAPHSVQHRDRHRVIAIDQNGYCTSPRNGGNGISNGLPIGGKIAVAPGQIAAIYSASTAFGKRRPTQIEIVPINVGCQ